MVWTTIETEDGPVTVLRPANEVPPDRVVVPNEASGTPYDSDDSIDGIYSRPTETKTGAGSGSNAGSNAGTRSGSTRNRNSAATSSDVASREPIGSPRRGGLVGFLAGEPPHLPLYAAFGAYSGYPSAIGLQLVVPTDATLAFRSGFTGFPGIGYLLTPGIEIRFGHTPGTYSVDSGYAFSNLYIGETVDDGPNTEHWGLESGIGYRFILPDRRGVRWVAALEFGGRWTTESAWPDQPTIRGYWLIASP